MLCSTVSEICQSPFWVTSIRQAIVMNKLFVLLRGLVLLALGLGLGSIVGFFIGPIAYRGLNGQPSNHGFGEFGAMCGGSMIGGLIGFYLGFRIGYYLEVRPALKDGKTRPQQPNVTAFMPFGFQDFHIAPTTSDTPNLIPEQKLVPQPPANKPIPEQPEQPQGANGNDLLDAATATSKARESESTDAAILVSEFESLDSLPDAESERSEAEVVTGEQTAGAGDSSTFSKSARLTRRWQR